MMRLLLALGATLGCETPVPVPPRSSRDIEWTVDPSRSRVTFRVAHFIVQTVTGRFGVFAGTVLSEDSDFTSARIDATAETASVDTGDAERDLHLRSPDFLSAAQYPRLTLAAVARGAGDTLKADARLEIRGVCQVVPFTAVRRALSAGASPNRVVLVARATIHRLDFGVKWNPLVNVGGAIVGNDVEIELDMELVRTAPVHTS